MKILNLFSGIGGNRKLWDGNKHNITSVEFNEFIANLYIKRFPNDEVIIGDAIAFFEKHFMEYDFIWLSPPCQTHTMYNMVNFKIIGYKVPDLTSLYGTMLILLYFAKNLWVIENVNPWYKELKPITVKLGRHYYWSNFSIPPKEFTYEKPFQDLTIEDLEKLHDVENLIWDSNKKKRQILRNCVDYRIGGYILDCAIKTINKKNKKTKNLMEI